MNTHKFLSLFAIIIIFFSCESKHNNKESESSNQVLDYHSNGEVRLIVKNDTAFSYYKTGEIESKAKIVNGQKEGVSYLFFRNGNIKSIANYKNNMINGELILFHENGSKAVVGTYKDNKQDGDKYYFYENGSKRKNMLKKEY